MRSVVVQRAEKEEMRLGGPTRSAPIRYNRIAHLKAEGNILDLLVSVELPCRTDKWKPTLNAVIR